MNADELKKVKMDLPYQTIAMLPVVWTWDFFGNGALTIGLNKEINWWQRFLTSLLLGSKWRRGNVQ